MVVDAVPIPEDFPEAVQTRCTRSSTCLSLRLCSEIRCLGCVNTLQSFVGYMENGDSTSKDPKQILLSVKNIGLMPTVTTYAQKSVYLTPK